MLMSELKKSPLKQIVAGVKCIAVMLAYCAVIAYVYNGIQSFHYTLQEGLSFVLAFTAACFFVSLIFIFKPYS
jgi:hypothetical protein